MARAVKKTYIDPISGNKVTFALVPISQIEVPEYQRKLSQSLVKELVISMSTVGYFTTPVVLYQNGEKYFVIDGQHRVEAAKSLGIQHVPAIVVDDKKVAERILYLNTEKQPSSKEQAEQAYVLYNTFLKENPEMLEKALSDSISEPFLVTAGFALAENPKLSVSTLEVLSSSDNYFKIPLKEAANERKRRAKLLLELYQEILNKEEELKAAGVDSPFLRKMIVSRANPYKRVRTKPAFEDFVAELIERVKELQPSDFSEPEEISI